MSRERKVNIHCSRCGRSGIEYITEEYSNGYWHVVDSALSSGWDRYVGLDGEIIGMTTFGASAPQSQLFEHFGFKVVDSNQEYELMALQFDKNETPKFTDSAKKMEIDSQDFTIYYSNECPFVEHQVEELSQYSKDKKMKINFIKIDSLEKAKNTPCVFNNRANFYK